MPIVVPPAEPDDTVIDVSQEISQNRRLTHYFIMSSPRQIALIPMQEVRTPSGAVRYERQLPRPMQTFRLIPMSAATPPSPSTTDEAGQQRRYDYVLLGEWNSDMEENDIWEDDLGQQWVISAMISYNGYEKRGLIVGFGREPSHG